MYNAKRGGIYSRVDRYDPIKGWALKPNISNMIHFGNNILSSNSKGIRGKIEYAYARNKDKLRILILGDSFTFGQGVSDNETYPYYLQQILPDTEVINLGVHGYGHDQMLIYLKEEGIKYKPDIIILGYIAMDADRNMLTFRDYAKPKFELAAGKLKLSNFPVSSPQVTFKEEFWRSKFIDILSILYNRFLCKTGLYERERKELTDAILRDIAVTARSINATPLFVYMDNVRSMEFSEDLSRREQDFLNDCRNILVDCLFLDTYFKNVIKQGARIKKGGHFDANTNEIIALGIKGYLVDSGLINKRKIAQ
jgi:hypothetical protein